VTVEGLEEQLLGVLAKKELPEMEAKKNKLVKKLSQDQKVLSKLEDDILSFLQSTKEKENYNILDDSELIAKLEESKNKSTIISKNVIDANKTNAIINEKRLEYLPSSKRCTIIYFIVADLALIDPM